MSMSTFTFAKRECGTEFRALDKLIAQIARSTPRYRGGESWDNASNGQSANVHFWETMESLQARMTHAADLGPVASGAT